MLSYYVIYCENVRKFLQRTEKVALKAGQLINFYKEKYAFLLLFHTFKKNVCLSHYSRERYTWREKMEGVIEISDSEDDAVDHTESLELLEASCRHIKEEILTSDDDEVMIIGVEGLTYGSSVVKQEDDSTPQEQCAYSESVPQNRHVTKSECVPQNQDVTNSKIVSQSQAVPNSKILNDQHVTESENEPQTLHSAAPEGEYYYHVDIDVPNQLGKLHYGVTFVKQDWQLHYGVTFVKQDWQLYYDVTFDLLYCVTFWKLLQGNISQGDNRQ